VREDKKKTFSANLTKKILSMADTKKRRESTGLKVLKSKQQNEKTKNYLKTFKVLMNVIF
jgi:hypothetical protein